MKLFLYSGGGAKENFAMDQHLIKITGKKSPSMAYIPYCHRESEIYFRDFVDQYRPFGVRKFIHFPVDLPIKKVLLDEALKCDVIHLSGGNTYYFLNSLRKSGMLRAFKKYVRDGGILTGLSAGAIIMCPCIETAGFPSFDHDENEEGLTDLRAMGLVNFNFFPHYRYSKRYDAELALYSQKSKRPLYACPDGGGIIVTEESLTFVNRAIMFLNGTKVLIK